MFHANWFALRDHPMAEHNLQHFAKEMQDQYWDNKPKFLVPGQWHMPYLPDVNELRNEGRTPDDLIKIAVGRCARVSYLNHDGVRNPDEDIALHDKLATAKPPHMAPFEHVAMSMDNQRVLGNFQGWMQLRYKMPEQAGPPEPRFDAQGNCTNYDVATRRPLSGLEAL
jgi:hypothetical protein